MPSFMVACAPYQTNLHYSLLKHSEISFYLSLFSKLYFSPSLVRKTKTENPLYYKHTGTETFYGAQCFTRNQLDIPSFDSPCSCFLSKGKHRFAFSRTKERHYSNFCKGQVQVHLYTLYKLVVISCFAALMSGKACSEDLFLEIVNHYVRGASDMNGRSSGIYI